LALRARLEALFRNQTDSTLVQLFRYTFVGGLAFLVDFGALYALTEGAGLHYLVSAALSFGLGLLTNYGLSVAWVFPRRRLRSRWAEFGLFGLIGLVGLGFNEVAIWLLTEKLGLHYLMSKIASTGGVYLWNFFARKLALFSKES
jgi:putative flippase GtrA